MYCVKCGIRLQEGIEACPLCSTPVWNPDKTSAPSNFSKSYPRAEADKRYPVLAFVTAILAVICVSCLIFCLNTYDRVFWSGYVMLGIAMVYFSVIFPFWFEKRHPLIFVPLCFCLICGYLLYICLYTGGHWFLTFAFPIVMITGIVSTASVALFRYIKRGRIFIMGGLFVAIGGCSMLIEMFQNITFGSRMFTWSLYTLSFFAAVGLFLLISGAIRPMREYLQRKLFF